MMVLAMDKPTGPVTDDERARIVELLESGLSYAKVAEQTGRGQGTVSRVAAAAGWSAGHSAAARTRNAREARSAYTAEARAKAAERAQERVQELLDGFFDERQQVVVIHGGDGAGTDVVDVKPDWRAISDMAKAVNTLQRTVLDIDRHDNRADEGAAAVDQWLRSIVGEAA